MIWVAYNWRGDLVGEGSSYEDALCDAENNGYDCSRFRALLVQYDRERDKGEGEGERKEEAK